jgi:hypothetical protein
MLGERSTGVAAYPVGRSTGAGGGEYEESSCWHVTIRLPTFHKPSLHVKPFLYRVYTLKKEGKEKTSDAHTAQFASAGPKHRDRQRASDQATNKDCQQNCQTSRECGPPFAVWLSLPVSLVPFLSMSDHSHQPRTGPSHVIVL